MAKFSYGYDGMADRQLASLAKKSTMATQTISTTQSTLFGWNGEKISNTASAALMMVRTRQIVEVAISAYPQNFVDKMFNCTK